MEFKPFKAVVELSKKHPASTAIVAGFAVGATVTLAVAEAGMSVSRGVGVAIIPAAATFMETLQSLDPREIPDGDFSGHSRQNTVELTGYAPEVDMLHRPDAKV